MADVEVWTEVTTYTVCALPKDDIEWFAWSLTVENRGDGKWAVCRYGRTMTRTGRWRYERSNSSRTDGYLKYHRHDLDTALRLAREHAPKVIVNGMTPADALEWRGATEEGRDAVRVRIRARWEKSKAFRREMGE